MWGLELGFPAHRLDLQLSHLTFRWSTMLNSLYTVLPEENNHRDLCNQGPENYFLLLIVPTKMPVGAQNKKMYFVCNSGLVNQCIHTNLIHYSACNRNIEDWKLIG